MFLFVVFLCFVCLQGVVCFVVCFFDSYTPALQTYGTRTPLNPQCAVRHSLHSVEAVREFACSSIQDVLLHSTCSGAVVYSFLKCGCTSGNFYIGVVPVSSGEARCAPRSSRVRLYCVRYGSVQCPEGPLRTWEMVFHLVMSCFLL